MSTPSITQRSLHDYSALPVLRDTIAAKATGVTITNLDLPDLDLTFLLQQATASGNPAYRLSKKTLASDSTPIQPRLDASLRTLHVLSTALFNNLSHVLELPWEKYLAEIHEYSAPDSSELIIARNPTDLPTAWSTLTLLIDPAQPTVCHVSYGEALSVLSENQVRAAGDLPLDGGAEQVVVYHVRLNDSTFYTRTAGALMTPLSDEEYELRKAVGELGLVY